mgnify:CR=1 FL=1
MAQWPFPTNTVQFFGTAQWLFPAAQYLNPGENSYANYTQYLPNTGGKFR